MPEYKKIIKAAANEALQRLIADASSDIHGTMYGYTHGCRCDRCRAANAEYVAPYVKASQERVKKRLESDQNDKRHGTYYGYRVGCRCDRCTEANRVHGRESMRRHYARKRAEVSPC